MSEFSSPNPRYATIHLEHFAGFLIEDPDHHDPSQQASSHIDIAQIEQDAVDTDPIALRQILEDDTVLNMSNAYLLGHLVIPNLPLGLYGDTSGPPVLLNASIAVHAPDPNAHPEEFHRLEASSVTVNIVPYIGKLAEVSYDRDLRLGGHGMDWFNANREGCQTSLFGGLLVAKIRYDPDSYIG